MKNDEEENIKMNAIAAIYNCVNLICFTVLAIIFRKWWIVLVSILFYGSVKKSKE